MHDQSSEYILTPFIWNASVLCNLAGVKCTVFIPYVICAMMPTLYTCNFDLYDQSVSYQNLFSLLHVLNEMFIRLLNSLLLPASRLISLPRYAAFSTCFNGLYVRCPIHCKVVTSVIVQFEIVFGRCFFDCA